MDKWRRRHEKSACFIFHHPDSLFFYDIVHELSKGDEKRLYHQTGSFH